MFRVLLRRIDVAHFQAAAARLDQQSSVHIYGPMNEYPDNECIVSSLHHGRAHVQNAMFYLGIRLIGYRSATRNSARIRELLGSRLLCLCASIYAHLFTQFNVSNVQSGFCVCNTSQSFFAMSVSSYPFFILLSIIYINYKHCHRPVNESQRISS